MIIKITVDGKDIYSQKGWTILKALSYLKIDILRKIKIYLS